MDREYKLNIIMNICEDNIIFQGIEDSLNRLGHHIVTINYPITNTIKDLEFQKSLEEKIKDESIDLFFSINYYPYIAMLCNKLNLQYYAWTVDAPHLPLFSPTIHYETNHIYIFDLNTFNILKQMGVKTISYLPLATNTEKTSKLEITPEDKFMYSHDITFIGSLYNNNFYNDIKYLPIEFKEKINMIIEKQINTKEHVMDDLIDKDFVSEFKKYVKYDLGDYFIPDDIMVKSAFIGPKIAEIERVVILDLLGRYYDTHIYTGSKIIEDLPITYHSYIDFDQTMPKIFKLSKINLNITKRSISTGLPLRIFDIMGAGGFLITNYQSEMLEYFVPDEDFVLYESLQDLKLKAKYYLEHGDERERIAKNGFEKIKKYHTFDIRFKEIFKDFTK